MKIALIIVLVLLIICALIAYFMDRYIVLENRQTLEEAYNWQKEHIDISWWEGLEKTEYLVKGFEGYELHTIFCKNPDKPDSDKYVIITHGHTDNRYGALKYMKNYLDRGYHCIIYDIRSHGLNKRVNCTYSINEAKDLCCMIEDVRARYGNVRILGLQGESLGSATTIRALGHKPQVDFAVADCGFSDIVRILEGMCKHFHTPVLVERLASVMNKIRFGYYFKEMRPIDALADNEVPVLFIHGGADDFIVPDNSYDMAKADKGYNEVHIIDGAGHAASIITDPASYRQYLYAFLDKVVKD